MVSGQDKSFWNQGKDTISFFKQNDQYGISLDRNIIPELKPYSRRYQERPEKDYSIYDSIVAERYPGAERYYGRKSYLESFTYRKSFVLEPDPANKQFLIIKDPIRNTVRR